jgi:phosphotransferase system  glucose/maltose/N-acetylglucosamine-specific IIC component
LPDDRFSFSRYAYYCLRALKIPPPIPDKFITTIQILQMIVGTVIQGASMYYYSKDEGLSCKVDYWNLVAGGIMYGSYFCLFFQFAINRFILKRPTTSKVDSEKKKKKKQ